jgi:hypothetical protein
MTRRNLLSALRSLAHRRRSSLVRTAAGCTSLLLLWVGTGLFLFVAPVTDSLRRADVLLVLAPTNGRVGYAEQLMKQGYAGDLALSVPTDPQGQPPPSLCNEKRTYRIVCFAPEPVTTQGEARALHRLTADYGWKSAMVLTVQSHITRASVLLQRCYRGELRMVASWENLPLLSVTNPRSSWAYRFLYETGAFIKAALDQSC